MNFLIGYFVEAPGIEAGVILDIRHGGTVALFPRSQNLAASGRAANSRLLLSSRDRLSRAFPSGTM